MIHLNAREDIIALTPQWKGERFPDGRPRVPDRYLEKMRKMTLEELWKPILSRGTRASLRAISNPYMMTDAFSSVAP